jgi:hypothetical protein
MINVYSKRGDLLNIIYSPNDFKDGSRFDITDQYQSLQCAIMKAESGKVFKAHRHLHKDCSVHIQEVFIILKGKASIEIFDFDDSSLGEYPINEGDISILLNGGHSLKIDQDCVLYEIKTGPYEGQTKDKIFL